MVIKGGHATQRCLVHEDVCTKGYDPKRQTFRQSYGSVELDAAVLQNRRKGLRSEEYDCGNQRLLGNFPQAFSHVGLVNTAYNLASESEPADQRRGEGAVTKRRSARRSGPRP